MSEVRPLAPADSDRLAELLIHAFNFGPAYQSLYRTFSPSEWRGLDHEGLLRAALRVLPFGQFFGGPALP